MADVQKILDPHADTDAVVVDPAQVCVIIPSLNEAENIGALVERLRSEGYFVLVIDDGSRDETERIAREKGAKVIKNERNIGKGASLRLGFSYAMEHDFRFIVTMDGDGQHNPKQIRDLLKTSLDTQAGIVVGNRMSNPTGMPFIRWLTNGIMSWFLSHLCQQDIPDTQCGFRLIRKEVLEKTHLNTSNFEIESELLINAARCGIPIVSVPIKSIYWGGRSRIHPFKDTIRFLVFIKRNVWKRGS